MKLSIEILSLEGSPRSDFHNYLTPIKSTTRLCEFLR